MEKAKEIKNGNLNLKEINVTPTISLLPTDEEVIKWYSENIDKDCTPSSAIKKFRMWLQERINPIKTNISFK